MTPWELAKETEHSQQRALFSWANLVARYGFEAGANPLAYSMADQASISENVKLQWKPVPELALLFAIHNQGHGDKIRGAQAKAEGVKAGVPDLMLPVPVGMSNGRTSLTLSNRCIYGLFIELKKVQKGKVSLVQFDWGINLQKQGYGFRVCRGWIEAANDISLYIGSGVVIK